MYFEIPNCIIFLVEIGIEPKMCYSEKLGIYFDMQTKAKSHLYLYGVDGPGGKTIWRASKRYDRDVEIRTLDDLIYEVKDCDCYRDMMDGTWVEIINGQYNHILDKIRYDEL